MTANFFSIARSSAQTEPVNKQMSKCSENHFYGVDKSSNLFTFSFLPLYASFKRRTRNFGHRHEHVFAASIAIAARP